MMDMPDMLDGMMVLNKAHISHNSWSVEYFHSADAARKILGSGKEEKNELQRWLDAVSVPWPSRAVFCQANISQEKTSPNIQVVSFNPGAMSGESHMMTASYEICVRN